MSAASGLNNERSARHKPVTRKPKKRAHTPVMRQFFAAKAECPDAILFFRLGDFYEMFYDDAVRAAELLELTLTSRGKGPDGERIPMAGVPHHAAAGYLARLLAAGERVALCEQMADPSQVKGVVPRQIVRVVTPGLCHDPASLDARTNNYLTAVVAEGEDGEGESVALASLDISTGELEVSRAASQTELISELLRLEPREIILNDRLEDSSWLQLACAGLAQHLPQTSVRRRLEPEVRSHWPEPASWLADASNAEQRAVSLALGYAQESLRGADVTIHRASRGGIDASLALDDAAVRNLELVKTLRGERHGSLLAHLDHTMTALGARALRKRMLAPSQSLAQIHAWSSAVEQLFVDGRARNAIREALRSVRDIERLAVRAEMALAHPRDLAALRASLEATRTLARIDIACVREQFGQLDLCDDIRDLLDTELAAEPPVAASGPGVIRAGVSATLDELRELAASGKEFVARLEERERQRTGIGSLKIKYTRVFGYYLEVTKSNLGSVPDDYQRKQTIANGERYITEELNELQDKILSAQDRALKLEVELFAKMRAKVGAAATRLHALASQIAAIDVAAALAEVAVLHDYVRPQMHAEKAIELVQSRHPIVETLLPAGSFIANDISLDVAGERFAMITGPNMAGKSTVMRQVALAVVMAQMGGFVAARQARIGVVDRILTRVGASDSIAHGQSTFMVEMTETASILKQASERSLVIVDEIGRGTSTYDGLAIAWAVAEYLHETTGCMTLFATHYHELCTLASKAPGSLVNLHVAATSEGQRMVFVHELRRGSASRSYGVDVARLAGLPSAVLARAQALLSSFESEKKRGLVQGELFAPQAAKTSAGQAEGSAASEVQRVRDSLGSIDLNEVTPIDAWHLLRELQQKLSIES